MSASISLFSQQLMKTKTLQFCELFLVVPTIEVERLLTLLVGVTYDVNYKIDFLHEKPIF